MVFIVKITRSSFACGGKLALKHCGGKIVIKNFPHPYFNISWNSITYLY